MKMTPDILTPISNHILPVALFLPNPDPVSQTGPIKKSERFYVHLLHQLFLQPIH